MSGTLLLALLVLLLAGWTFMWRTRKVTFIYPPKIGLLYRDGAFERELPPGRYVRFDPLKRTKIVQVSLAELPIQLGEITVLSKDQFSFRLSLAPILKVSDARTFIESQASVDAPASAYYLTSTTNHAALQPLIAAAAMEAVSAKMLSEILADQTLVSEAVEMRLADAIPGARIEHVLTTGINLPPETRKMFTDVERARMEAQAGVERARGEQAALRVLANAARLVTDNPALANLRLLQAIESSKGSTTIILGNPPGGPGTGLPVSSS